MMGKTSACAVRRRSGSQRLPKKPSMPRGTAANPAETGTICAGAAFIWRISVKIGLPARSPEIPDQWLCPRPGRGSLQATWVVG
jgi:hypothetical protein